MFVRAHCALEIASMMLKHSIFQDLEGNVETSWSKALVSHCFFFRSLSRASFDHYSYNF